ncbi:diguanylate cyclase (GGDEF) domain-containing protein [Lachnospiraceae bacterium C7]|nr:diguanylate cyclase (GGDEF) domain-containing protein [Lachnospiraceae bacterium C7]
MERMNKNNKSKKLKTNKKLDERIEAVNGKIGANIAGGFFIYRATGNEEIVYADSGTVDIFDCKDYDEFMEYVGGTFKGLVYREDLAETEYSIWSQINDKKTDHDFVSYRILSKNGTIKYIEDFGHLFYSETGEAFFYVFIIEKNSVSINEKNIRLLNEKQTMFESMKEELDALTGLYRMHKFCSHIEEISKDSDKILSGLYLIYFDIVNFKSFNGAKGFEAGDNLLKYVAVTIRTAFKDDIIARFSDDHFVVCTSSVDLIEIVEEIHEKIKRYSDDRTVEIKAGIYQVVKPMKDGAHYCDKARLACVSIKSNFDKYYNFYDDDLGNQVNMQQYIIDNIGKALNNGSIVVFYQPIVRIITGKVCAFEALARWIDPEYGMLSPGVFIEVLEKFHLIHKLDIFIIEKVCADFAKKRKEGAPVVPVSINLSRLDFQLCEIFDIVEKTRKKYDIPARMLDIEITESALNEDLDFLKNQIELFKKAGYNVWMDDFGSGYSALNILTSYNFDVAKLDMIFLRHFKDEKMRKMIRSLVYTVKDVGIQSFSEGVETREQRDFLAEIGCEKGQGYFFGKPLPIEEGYLSLMSRGKEFETVEESKYYDEIGKINIKELDTDQIDGISLPTAIIEMNSRRIKILRAPKQFIAEIKDLGFSSIEELEEFCNDDVYQNRLRMCGFIDRAIASQKREKTDWIVRNHYCTIWVEVISECSKSFAIKIMFLNQHKFMTENSKVEEMDAVLRFLYLSYNRIDCMDVTDNTIESIYVNARITAPSIEKKDATGVLEMIAEKYIHPDDRKLFLEFYDYKTVESRLKKVDTDFLGALFRFRQDNGEYIWQVFSVMLVKRNGKQTIISTIRDLDATGESMFRLQDYTNMFEHLPLAYALYRVEVDEQNKPTDAIYEYFNSKYAKLIGRKVNDLMGKSFYDEIPDASPEWLDYCYRAAYLGEEIHKQIYSPEIEAWIDFSVSQAFSKGYCAYTFKDVTNEHNKNNKIEKNWKTDDFIIKCTKILQGTASFEYSMHTILNEISEMIRPDRMYIIEIRDENVKNSYMWHKESIEPNGKLYEKLSYKIVANWKRYLDKDASIVLDTDKRINTEEMGETVRNLLINKGIHRMIAVPLYNVGGEVVGYLGAENYVDNKTINTQKMLETVSYFISSEMNKQELIKNLDYMCNNDIMTEIHNRNSMDRELRYISLVHPKVGILFADVNGLKAVNDSKGHSAGDELLIEVARLLKKVFNRNDIYRAGGDEFVVLLSRIEKEEFLEKVEEFKEILRRNPEIKIAIGYTWDDGHTDLNKVLRNADKFMYENKAEYYRIKKNDRRNRKKK